MQKFTLILIIIAFSLTACHTGDSHLRVNLRGIHIDPIEISQYGKDLFALDSDNIAVELKELAQNYPVFLSADLNDSSNIQQLYEFISDPQLIQLNADCREYYPDLSFLEEELFNAFRYYRYHFEDYPIPDIYTYISGLHYEYPIQLGDNSMIIGLDLYLGTDYEVYPQIGIPAYKMARMTSDYITIDCMKEMAFAHLPGQKVSRTFLDEIITNGKILYFLDAMLPDTEDHLKIGYTVDQYAWCEASESNIWAFFIEKQMLYSADYELIKKFCMDGPFTAALSNDSPGAIGNWIGWQIVRAFMKENPDVTLSQLMHMTDSQKILSDSRYKPRR